MVDNFIVSPSLCGSDSACGICLVCFYRCFATSAFDRDRVVVQTKIEIAHELSEKGLGEQ